MSSRLLIERRFAPLFWTQALGAFNDNLLRMVLLLAWAAASQQERELGWVPGLIAVTFLLPFLLLSSWGGLLGDRLDKQRLIRRLKLLELVIISVASVAVWFESVVMLFVVLLMMGVKSALFGPVKYAILPQHLVPTELVNGNAWVTVGSFTAILAGILLASSLMTLPDPWSRLAVILSLVGVAGLGLLASFAVPPAPPRARIRGAWHPWRSTWELLRQGVREKHLFPAMLGIGAFWFLSIGYLALLPAWARDIVGDSASSLSLLLTAFVMGVGGGALLCARFSAGRLELGLVPLGALLIGAASLYLASLTPLQAGLEESAILIHHGGFWQMLVGFALVGVGGGLYSVPLYTLIQVISHEERRARMISAANIVNALLSSVAAACSGAMLVWLESGPRPFVATLGAIALVIGTGLWLRRPRPVLRLMIFALVHVIYRLRFRGRQHIPVRGAALVVCNHVSFMDALVLGGASPRPLRFLMDQPIYESPWLNWWFRIVGAIPVNSDRRDPGNVRRALNEVSHALRQGEVVMLFPEGRLTPDGEIQGFRRGLDMILARDPVPVVPAGLAGLWGSWTSHYGGRALSKLPRRFRARVALSFGEPLSAREARSPLLETRVRELKAEAESWVAGRGKSPLTQS